jgi:hypothetical protein
MAKSKQDSYMVDVDGTTRPATAEESAQLDTIRQDPQHKLPQPSEA